MSNLRRDRPPQQSAFYVSCPVPHKGLFAILHMAVLVMGALSIVMAVLLVMATIPPAAAQDASRLVAGEAAWNTAGCFQCHGTSGEGGTGAEFPAGPSLQTTQFDRAALVETISCGLPGTPMPAWLDGAYTKRACYGFPLGAAPGEVVAMPVLTAADIETLVDYLMAKIVRR
jgi:mono/diheme cytochrome c family protein